MWDQAKYELSYSNFPMLEIQEKLKKIYDEDKKAFEIKRETGLHHGKKERHGVNRITSKSHKVKGFTANFWYDYCEDCAKVVRKVGAIFNNEENLAYMHIFHEENDGKVRRSAVDIFDGTVN